MDLYIYSDESGVFDKAHNDYFVYGGLIFLDENKKNIATRKYISLENKIKSELNMDQNTEAKASNLPPDKKKRLYNLLSNEYKFGVIINEKKVLNAIFNNKKSKQRYLDYAYKIALKKALCNLDRNNVLRLTDIKNIYIYVDEHTTATDGKYELKEALLSELKEGTFNFNFSTYFPAIISQLKKLKLKYVNSKTNILVRASDIIANKLFANIIKGKEITSTLHQHIIFLP